MSKQWLTGPIAVLFVLGCIGSSCTSLDEPLLSAVESAHLRTAAGSKGIWQWLWFSPNELVHFREVNKDYRPYVVDVNSGQSRPLRPVHNPSFKMLLSPDMRWWLIKDFSPDSKQVPWRAQEVNGNRIVRWYTEADYPTNKADWTAWLPNGKGILNVVRFPDHINVQTFTFADSKPASSNSFSLDINEPVFVGVVNRKDVLTLHFSSTEEQFPGHNEHSVDWVTVTLESNRTISKKWAIALPDKMNRGNLKEIKLSPSGERLALILETRYGDPASGVERDSKPDGPQSHWIRTFWFGTPESSHFTRLARLIYPHSATRDVPGYYFLWSPDGRTFSFSIRDEVHLLTVP